MKFVAISDTHGKHRALKLPKGDVVIHAGDFCYFGNEQHVYDFIKWYKALDYQTKILIGGNHDFFAAEQRDKLEVLIGEEIIYLQDSGIEINGIKIWGSPYHPDLLSWAFGKERGDSIKVHWDLIPNDTEILITHTPPYCILDKTRFGKSIGCEELLNKLEILKIKYHIFGHVHSSYGQVIQGNTTYINASNLDSTKGLVNSPIVFEI